MDTLTISWRPSGLSRPFGNPRPTLCGLDAHHGIHRINKMQYAVYCIFSLTPAELWLKLAV
jgi:hypothetical protein